MEKVIPTEVKSVRDRPINVNNTKLTQFRFPNIRYATQAFPVIIEPVARAMAQSVENTPCTKLVNHDQWP